MPGLLTLQAQHCPLPCPQAPNKALASILGKTNLRFAGMSIAVSISTDGLNLSVPATRQVSAATRVLSPQQPPVQGRSRVPWAKLERWQVWGCV